MNVVNMGPAIVSTDSTMTVSGKTAPAATPFASLFTAELTGMLGTIQPSVADAFMLQNGDEGQGTDDEQLLAMLEQLMQAEMLAGLAQASVAEGEDQALLVQNKLVASAGNLSADEQQHLVSTFMQQGISKEDAARIIQLLTAAVATQTPEEQPELQQVSQKAAAIAAQLGINGEELVAAQPKQEKKSAANVGNQAPALLLTKEARYAPMIHMQPEKQQTLMPHQVNAALSMYQPGMVSKQVQPQVSIEQLIQSMGRTTAEMTDAGAGAGLDAAPMTGNSVQSGQFATVLQGNQSNQTASQQLVRADQFVADMNNLFVKQMKIVGGNGISEAKLILHPQSLGMVDVRITATNHVITAHFAAESQAGKELLDNQLPQLRAALIQMGLQVDRLEVTQQQAQQPQFGFSQQREGQQQQQEQQQRESGEQQAEFNLEALTQESESASATWLKAKQANVEYSV